MGVAASVNLRLEVKANVDFEQEEKTEKDAYPTELIFENHLILNIILKHALKAQEPLRTSYYDPYYMRNPQIFRTLSAKEGCRLRGVCRFWNQEVCTIFLRQREPLLWIEWKWNIQYLILRMWTCPFQSLLKDMDPSTTLYRTGSLPPFGLYVDKSFISSVRPIEQFKDIMEILLVRLEGAKTLVELIMRDYWAFLDKGERFLHEILPELPDSLQFPVLQSLMLHFSFLELEPGPITGSSAPSALAAGFFQRLLENSPELKRLDWQTPGWLPTPGNMRTRLSSTEVGLPRGPMPMQNLTSLEIYCYESPVPEGILLQILDRCRNSLEYVHLNKYGPDSMPEQQLDLEEWPLMPVLKRIGISGSIVILDPRDPHSPRDIKRKFPALEVFDADMDWNGFF